ncbi:MAG: class I SAM-dependent methyltransferase [Dehalococcoidia bacterium]
MGQRTAESHTGFLAALAERNERSRLRVQARLDTVGFAQIVSLGRVVGVDLNEDDIRGVEELVRIVETPNATFRSTDIYALPFADESFDAVFAHGVMEHLAELDAAIREMFRVLKLVGLIGARSSDHDRHIYFPQDSLIDESLKFIKQVVKPNGGDRNIGRHLRALFIEAGIERVEASASYESSGSFDQTRADGESMALIFLEPSFVKAAVKEGYEDDGRLEEIAVAWNFWSEWLDSFRACAWCEIVGSKQ